MARGKNPPRVQEAASYSHPDAKSLLRPDVGTQAQFRKKKPPTTLPRYLVPNGGQVPELADAAWKFLDADTPDLVL